MFIFTAKLDKRRLAAAILLAAVIIVAAVLIFRSPSEDTQAGALSAVVRNNEQRVGYLTSLGWEVEPEPIESQTIIIPKEFDEVYSGYNRIQMAQGFDLSEYAGREAVRYTYRVSNYPSADQSVVADMIVYRNEIIAGDIQSVSADGFMSGLEFPD